MLALFSVSLFCLIGSAFAVALPDDNFGHDGVSNSRWMAAELFEGDIEGRQFNEDFDADAVQLWPGGLIPFDISDNLDVLQAVAVSEAIEELTQRSCLKFFSARPHHVDKIEFMPAAESQGCSSSVGKVGGTQQIRLTSTCASKSAVLHLILHSLGFWHEHSRTDRRELVEIIGENIRPEERNQFRTYTNKEKHHEGEPYDLQSVLHLPLNAFATAEDLQTMRIRSDPSRQSLESTMGLSQSDVRKIRRRYCRGWEETEEETSASQEVMEVRMRDPPVAVDQNVTAAGNSTDKKKKKEADEDNNSSSAERRERERRREEAEERRRESGKVKKTKKKGGRGRRIVEEVQRVGRATDRKKKAKKSRSRERPHSQHGHVHSHHQHHISATERKENKSILTRMKRGDSSESRQLHEEEREKIELDRKLDMERRWAEGDEDEKRK